MTKNVTFQLGPSTGLSARQLTITRLPLAGDVLPIAATYNADVGAVSTATVALADNRLWIAKLVDTATGGAVGPAVELPFSTGHLQFPGPSSGDRLSISGMEDESSSSSGSSSSSSMTSSLSSSSSVSSSSWSSLSSSASSSSSSSSSSKSTSSQSSSHSSSSWSS